MFGPHIRHFPGLDDKGVQGRGDGSEFVLAIGLQMQGTVELLVQHHFDIGVQQVELPGQIKGQSRADDQRHTQRDDQSHPHHRQQSRPFVMQ